MDQVAGVFCACFVKEKYFWKLLCFCCTALLVHQILVDFLFVKPTGSTVERVKLSEDMFPDIIVCKDEGFNKEKLRGHGYDTVFGYATGGVHPHETLVGWGGNSSTDTLR